MNEFKRQLGELNWNSVLEKNDIDEAYDEFWSSYTVLYNRNFPLKNRRFNKNVHKIQQFMTIGLLTSRKSKNVLFKTSIAFPTAENIAKYKNFKSVYQRVVRAANLSDPVDIANSFNKFFVAVGQQISDNVSPISKNPEDYIHYNQDVPDMLLQNTTPEHVKKIISKL